MTARRYCGVVGCGRQIVRGRYLTWVHVTNPGRDHHYAKPDRAARKAQEERNG